VDGVLVPENDIPGEKSRGNGSGEIPGTQNPGQTIEIGRRDVEAGPGEWERLIRFHNESKAFVEPRTVADARNRGTGGRLRRDKATERLKNAG
jgi:hypothetical protein